MKLPLTNEYGYYEMRLESFDGQGADMCGEILDVIGARCLELNSHYFALSGEAGKIHVRWCAEGISLPERKPVEKPHLLGIFHEYLAQDAKIISGVSARTSVVVNAPVSPAKAREAFKIRSGNVYTLAANEIAAECGTRASIVMLGALAKAIGFIPLELMEEIILETIGEKHELEAESSVTGMMRGYNAADITTNEQ